jgi:hypothetical protein
MLLRGLFTLEQVVSIDDCWRFTIVVVLLTTSRSCEGIMPQRLEITNPDLFPIQAFFNSVSDASFMKVVDCLTSRIGYSINETNCTFPGDLDPGEESFEGVCLSLFEESVVISLVQLREYLEIVCRNYVTCHLADEGVLSKLLTRPFDG